MRIRVPSLSESRDAHPICPPAAAPVGLPGRVPASGDGVSASRYAIRRRTSSAPGPADQQVLTHSPSESSSVSKLSPGISLYPSHLRYPSHIPMFESSLVILFISPYPSHLSLSESAPVIRVISHYPSHIPLSELSESSPVI